MRIDSAAAGNDLRGDIVPAQAGSAKPAELFPYLIYLAWILAFIFFLMAGLSLRQTIWNASEPIRYRKDIGNGLRIGSTILGEAHRIAGKEPFDQSPVSWPQFFRGYISTYDRVSASSDDGRYSLDYAPLRLLVMSSWVKYTRDRLPAGLGYDDEMAWPLLWFNTAMELAAAMLMFWLVAFWTGHEMQFSNAAFNSKQSRPIRLWQQIVGGYKWKAWLAALLLWFNPAILLEAHAWPQWDVWILPFYLGAMCFSSGDRWLSAGLCLGIGCMFKGQMLFIAPVFVLWPLFSREIRKAVSVLLGLSVSFFGIASPWLLPGTGAWTAFLIAVLSSAMLLSKRMSKNSYSSWAIRASSFVAILALWLSEPSKGRISALIILGAFVVSIPWTFPRSALRYSLAFMLVTSLLLSSAAFGGSWSWFEVGFAFGLRHYPNIANGPVNNLPAVLAPILGWNVHTVLLSVSIPFITEPVSITTKVFLGGIFATCLVACSFGAAMHHRRRDPQILVALVAPWILFFAVNAQMHERYLFWGAALGGVAVASSVGLTLLNLLVSSLATGMIAQTLLEQNVDFAPQLLHFLRGTCPSLGWAVTLIAFIYLFSAIWPRSAIIDRLHED